MTETRRHVVAAAFLLAALSVTGCGSSENEKSPSSEPAKTEAPEATAAQREALDQMVAEGRSKIRPLMKTFEGTYSDIELDAIYPGTVRYRYVLANQVDPAKAAGELKKQAPTLKSSCKTGLFPMMKNAGVTVEPRIQYVYLNADKTEVWSYTCKP